MPTLPSVQDVRDFLGNFDILPNGTIPTDWASLEAAYAQSRATWFATHPMMADNDIVSGTYDVGNAVLAYGIPIGATAINYGIDQTYNTGPYSILPPRGGTFAQKATVGVFAIVIVAVVITIPK